MLFTFSFTSTPIFERRLCWWISFVVITCSASPAATELKSELKAAFRQGLGAETNAPLSITTHQGTTTLKTASLQKKCILCDKATLCHTARLLGAETATREPNRLPTLDLRLFPTDTRVWADGWLLPANQQTTVLEPGSHFLVATRNNVTTHFSTSLEMDQNDTTTLNDLSFAHLYRPLFTLGVIGLATGAATGGTGIAFLAIDDKCATTQHTAAGKCTHLHDTALAGGILVGTGAALVVTGLVLLIIRAHKQKRAQRQFFSQVEEANGFTHP